MTLIETLLKEVASGKITRKQAEDICFEATGTKLQPTPTWMFYKMTKLEQFVWRNRGTDFQQLATQTNRTLHSIEAAFKRAEGKAKAQGL